LCDASIIVACRDIAEDGFMTALPLDGLLVVALEQAVAAPFATRQLADLGARVVKVERPGGDFARGFDRTAHGNRWRTVHTPGGDVAALLPPVTAPA
jgi:hypothetical protein